MNSLVLVVVSFQPPLLPLHPPLHPHYLLHPLHLSSQWVDHWISQAVLTLLVPPPRLIPIIPLPHHPLVEGLERRVTVLLPHPLVGLLAALPRHPLGV